ncbi:hypothetical protein B0H17DRAFT_1049466 [Mycena rosella]|uniref:Uncharacterized protein n=1 Tax=Mycena rosella TaxID=1033263 RepID=A0AAD7DW94_MYCRO|nr:hypothetical protein B0H17DRAFT_1049466 [Mycena rosella]
MRNVESVQLNLRTQINEAMSRTSVIGADLSAAVDALTRARGALDEFRRSVFDRLSRNAPSPSLPARPPPGHPGTPPVTRILSTMLLYRWRCHRFQLLAARRRATWGCRRLVSLIHRRRGSLVRLKHLWAQVLALSAPHPRDL